MPVELSDADSDDGSYIPSSDESSYSESEDEYFDGSSEVSLLCFLYYDIFNYGVI